MTRARIRLEVPSGTWIREVSEAHPEATFRLLAGLEAGDGALEVGEVRGPDPEAASEAVGAHPAVEDHEALHVGDDRALARYRVRDVALYGFLREAGIPPAFPVVVEDGACVVELAASRSRIRSVATSLEESPLDVEVLWVAREGREGQEGDLLTDRQREALEAAWRAGYLAVPRECSLEELAAELDVDKSTASGVLRRAQERLAERHLARPGTTGDGHR